MNNFLLLYKAIALGLELCLLSLSCCCCFSQSCVSFGSRALPAGLISEHFIYLFTYKITTFGWVLQILLNNLLKKNNYNVLKAYKRYKIFELCLQEF